MFTVYGIRSLYTSVRFLRLCPFLTQKVPLCTFKEFNNRYSTSWTSLKITKPTREINNSLYFINPPTCTNYSTQSRASRDQKQLNKRIISLETVEEQLKLFASVKESTDIVNKVTVLFNIAKIIERDEKQQQLLEEGTEKSQKGQSSTYVELLKSISKDISKCNSWELANVVWALGKLKEKDHKLVQVCENEILARGIPVFNEKHICQIVNGCANLNMTTSDIFTKLHSTILDGQVNIQHFEDRELAGTLMSFAKVEKGSVELLDVFLKEILSRDFFRFEIRCLTTFVWSFAKREFVADKLFQRVQEEILNRGTTDLKAEGITQILWAFGTAEKGSKELFNMLDNELTSRNMKKFHNVVLLEIVWSFAKRNATKAKVFDVVKREVFNRGVHAFQTHELVLILWSFVSAQRHDDELVEAIDRELCLRDVKHFGANRFCQVAWSLGKAGKSDSNMFDVIEAEMFERGVGELTTKEKHMLMRGFIQARRGSNELYKLVVTSFSENDFCNQTWGNLCEHVWCFSKTGVEAGTLFSALEKEILTKDKSDLSRDQLRFIKYHFKKVGEGSKELFEL